MVEIKSNGKYNVLRYGINVWNNDPTKQQNTKPHLLSLCIDNHCMGLHDIPHKSSAEETGTFNDM